MKVRDPIALHENICSIQNRPSTDPCDQAIHAALDNAVLLARMVSDELRSSYRGPRRDVYLETLRSWVPDLAGRLEDGEGGDLVAQFPARRIALRFE